MKQHYIIPNWPAPDNIRAYTTTRLSGYSHPPYNSFNLSLTVGDDPKIVTRNREKLIQELALPETPCWLKQMHGKEVVDLDQYPLNPSGDACFTHTHSKVCVILAADCLPILICNHQGTEIAAIHAGWRGLLTGIIEGTIKALSSPPKQLLAWLGPAIGPTVFELNTTIRVDFLNNNPQNSDCFQQRNGNRWFANIYQLAGNSLKQCGVQTIYGGERCTYTEKDYFYSHRRDNGKTGRMASLIWIAK